MSKKTKLSLMIRKTSDVLLKDILRLSVYQVLYFLTAFCVLKPFFELVLQIAMKIHGYSYITMENLTFFLRKPSTIILGFIFLFCAGIIILYDMSVLTMFFAAKIQGHRVTILGMMFLTLKKLFRKKGKNIAVLIPASYTLLLAYNIPLILVLFTKSRILLYIQKILNLGKWKIPVIMLVLALFYLLLLAGIFVIQECVLDDKGIREAVFSGKRLLEGKLRSHVLLFVIWNGILSVICLLLYIIAIFISVLVIYITVKKAYVLASFYIVYEHIKRYVGFAAFLIFTTANTVLITFAYVRLRKSSEIPLRKSPIWTKNLRQFSRIQQVILACFLVLVLVVDVANVKIYIRGAVKWKNSDLGNVRITAHRGASDNAPENTLPAIQKAIDETADFVEIDVQETKDQVVVLMHDPDTKRTTGKKKFIWKMTYEQVQELDAGGWFSKKYKDTPIPTLEETLLLAKGKINLNIEIKTNQHTPDLEEHVVELIKKYRMQDQCVITCVHYSSLVKVKKADKNIKTGYITTTSIGNIDKKGVVDFYSMKSIFINKENVENLHKNGKEVHAWTVDKKNEIRRMKLLGVDNIITNKVVLAREIVNKNDANQNLINIVNYVVK